MREERWHHGHHVLVLEGTRVLWWPGGLELLLGHWSAGLARSLPGDNENSPTWDSEAMSTPLILGPLAHKRLPLMPRTRVPARGELITVPMPLLMSEATEKELSESHSSWSSGCSGFSSGSVSPTWRGNTEESGGHSIFANKLPKRRKELSARHG